MNGFLVELVQTMDELPIRLCKTKAEAIRIAKRTAGKPTQKIREVFNTDASTPICVAVTAFRNGRPIKTEVVKSFDA